MVNQVTCHFNLALHVGQTIFRTLQLHFQELKSAVIRKILMVLKCDSIKTNHKTEYFFQYVKF